MQLGRVQYEPVGCANCIRRQDGKTLILRRRHRKDDAKEHYGANSKILLPVMMMKTMSISSLNANIAGRRKDETTQKIL